MEVVDAKIEDEGGNSDLTAAVEPRPGAKPAVSIIVPPAPAAKGHVKDAVLEVTLSDGATQEIVDCTLSLFTMVTLPNVVQRKADTPAASVTPTPNKRRMPSATPTRTPTPSITGASGSQGSGSGVSTPSQATPAPTKRPLATPIPATHFPKGH